MNLNHVDFTGRMEEGRDNAAHERHRGRTVSRPHYAKPEPLEDTAENRLRVELAELRGELRERDNTIAVLQQGGNPDEAIEDAGTQFDRLFTAAKAQRQGLPSLPPLPPLAPPRQQGNGGARTMTRDQYLNALEKLGLTRASKHTAAALGLSLRQCQKYSAGEVAVPATLVKLIEMYLEHGMPSQNQDQ